jgi:hypothetical protein
MLAPLTAGPRMLGYVTRTPAASPTWWTAQLDRRRLWRSVTAADHAVTTASAAGAPLGDLPSLTRQLRRAAQSVDRALLAASRSGTGTPPAVQQRGREVRDNADRIYAAAMESLATTAHGETSHLTRAVQIEVEALRAGLQSSVAMGAARHG